MKKELNKCAECTHYNGEDCTHTSNIGIRVKYRQEYTYYIKKINELSQQKKCSKYEKI